MLATATIAWAHRWVPVVAMSILLAACASGPADQEPGAPSVTPGQGTASAPHSPDAEQEEAMITFAVEGGIANQMRSLQIDPTGQAQVEVNGRLVRGQLDQARVAQLVAALQSSGLFDRDRTYTAPPGGADLQRYEITNNDVTIVAYDTTVPAELDEAIRLLDEALRDVQR